MSVPQVKDVFLNALAQENAAARRIYLEQVCADDAELRRRVELLLKAHDEPASYLDRPALDLKQTTANFDSDREKSERRRDSEAVRATEGPGGTIAHYRILQEIGQGGFGVVYMAEQQAPVRRTVALKIIKPGMDTREVIARFEAERQALALMDHPNIARVLDAGATASGRPYFVMELVRGVPLTEFCDKNQFSTKRRLEMFITICQAVQHAHQKGVIHRDLKPSNIMVTLHDGKPVPKVIDFGISKAIAQKLTDKTLFTRYGQMIGTPQYMSPEQAEMSGLDVDTRSDVYSLGVILYELLTGTTPLKIETLREAGHGEMLRLIQEQEAPKPSTRLSTLTDRLTVICKQRSTNERMLSNLIRGDLDWIVMKSLDKDRSRRYETAIALAHDIQRHLDDEPVMAGAPSSLYLVQKLIRRNRGLFVAATAIASSLLIGLVFSLAGYARASVARHKALESEQAALKSSELMVTERDRANAKSDEARQNLYAADMLAVGAYLKEGNFAAARLLLDDHLPQEGQVDIRGWEWRYYQQKAQGEHFLRLDGHTDTIRQIAFSPDGQLLLSLSNKETILWDRAAEREIHRWDAKHSGQVGFSNDGSQIAIRHKDGVLELINKQHHLQAAFLCPLKSVAAFQFSQHGEEIFVLSEKSIHRWNPESGETTTLKLNDEVHRILAAGNTQNWLCLQTGKDLLVFDANEQKVICQASLPFRNITALRVTFMPDDSGLIIAPGTSGEAHHYSFESQDWSLALEGASHLSSVTSTVIGNKIVSCGYYHEVSIWDAAERKLVRHMFGHDDEVFSVAIDSAGRTIASGGRDDRVLLWNVELDSSLDTITGLIGPMPVVFAANSSLSALMLRPTMETQVYDNRTLSLVATVTGVPTCAINDSLVTITNGPAMPGAYGVDFTYWNTKTWKKTLEMSTAERALCIGGSADLNIAAIAYDNGFLEIFDMLKPQPTGHRIRHDLQLPELADIRVLTLAVCAAKSLVAIAGNTNGLRKILILNYANGTTVEIETPHEHEVSYLGFARGTKLIVSSSYDGRIKLWDSLTGQPIRTIRGHRRGVSDCDISPDGRTIASASHDGSMKLWQLATGRELMTMDTDFLPTYVAFSPDGSMLTALSADQLGGRDSWLTGPATFRIWRVPIE